MSARNPLKDKIAIAGIGSAPYGRNLNRTANSLGMEAAKKAIEDAGLKKEDIDGLIAGGAQDHSGTTFLAQHEGLGLGDISFAMDAELGTPVLHAAQAIIAGMCDTVLIVQAFRRGTNASSSAKNDPMRARQQPFLGQGSNDVAQRWSPLARSWSSAEHIAAFAGRYLYECKAPREVFGMIAINNRTGASTNNAAIMRTPITMEDYLNARMIREPLGLLDCDLPCDAGEAMVVTTAERARSLRKKPVYIHAATWGESGAGLEYRMNGDLSTMSHWVAGRKIWPKSDFSVTDIDIYYPYDGFSSQAVGWIEAAGFCGYGEAWGLFQSSWQPSENRLKLRGKTYVSPNGGSMSHGRAGGFNYYQDAVRQLRGERGAGQIPNAKVAMTGIGSFFHDPTITILRVD